MKFNVIYHTNEGSIKDYKHLKSSTPMTLFTSIEKYFEGNKLRKGEDAIIYYENDKGELSKIKQSEIITFEVEEV